MNLDPTQASLVIILAYCLRDGIILALAFILIGKIVNAQSCRYPPVPGPIPVPVPPGPIPPDPKPIAKEPRYTGITSTTFAGPHDSVDSSTSAYDGHIIRGTTELAAALPYHFPKPPIIRVFANGGKSVDVPVADVGPWNTHDTYPTIPGSRPLAEAQYANKTEAQNGQVPTNPAGLDCTPAVWKALGFTGDLEAITAKVSWDDVAYLGSAQPPGPTPPVIGDGLVKQSWPTQADCPTFYGSPSQVVASLVKVHCPWEFTVEGTKSQTITIHAKCAPSLTRVLNYIWQQCGQSQAKINEFGYDVFDGSYNPRNIGGTNTPSVHSYAAAMDWNAAANPQHAPLTETKFKPNSLIVYAFKAEGWIWGGDWSPASIDAMHFQAARVR